MSQADILLKNNTLRYFGCRDGKIDAVTEKAVESAVSEIQSLADFKTRSCRLSNLGEMPAFLHKENYGLISAYLPTASLFVATLGLAVDKKIKSLSAVNMSGAVIMNAAANAYLDYCVDTAVGQDEVLFCPGYSGTDYADIKEILQLLEAQKYIGIFTAASGIMLPEKSVAGLLLHQYKFTCKGCLISSKCEYLKQKTTCYANQ